MWKTSMSKKIGIILGSIYFIAAGIYWLRIGGGSTVVIRNSVYILIPLIATISGIFALDMYGYKGPRMRTLLLLTGGMGCWLLGEMLFYSYEFIFHINPFPSIADVFYLLAYPLLLLAFINEIRQAKISLKKIHPAIIFFFVVF